LPLLTYILAKVQNAIYDNHILYLTLPHITMSYTEPPSKRSKTGGDAGPSSNPYLAHLNPQQGNGSNGNGVAAGTGKNPLNGLVPRMVTTEQAKKILVSLLDTSNWYSS
jgi:hypothetical protein